MSMALLRAAWLGLGLILVAILPAWAQVQAQAQAQAQVQAPAGKTHRLAVLGTTELSLSLTRQAVVPALAAQGFVEGRNLLLDEATAAPGQLVDTARRLAAAGPDALIAIGGDAVFAAQSVSDQVPIIIFGPDPVRLGLARNMSKPGGNTTGVVILAAELDAKRLQLLHDAVPGARRIAVLMRAAWPAADASEAEMRKVAESLGIQLTRHDASGPEDYAAAFAAMRQAGAQALIISADPTFYRDTGMLLKRAAEAGLPAGCQWTEMARAGCLMSYGPNLTASRVRLADFVARIFRGATAAELPIEQPMTFDFVVNLATARARGIALPAGVIDRADEVVE